jgi:hypothetical protein
MMSIKRFNPTLCRGRVWGVINVSPGTTRVNLGVRQKGGSDRLFEQIDRNSLFHEMHRAIEETATVSVRMLMEANAELDYPPNAGLMPDERTALGALLRTPALERALRKVIADAAAYPLFHMLCIADGVADPPVLHDDLREDVSSKLSLHDGLYESYWAWRRRRPDPGWKLDTLVDE